MLNRAPAIAIVLSGMLAAAGTLGAAPAKRKAAAVSPRLQALGETCQARRGIAAEVFERHLTTADRRHKAWSIAVVGADAAARKARAEQIATAAGATLHVVDASALVAGYIGETEKNLSVLQREAAANNWVLFFDEADALFGKRTDVRSGHDRYAKEPASTIGARLAEHAELVLVGVRTKPKRGVVKLEADAVVLAKPKRPEGPVPPLPWNQLCWPRRAG